VEEGAETQTKGIGNLLNEVIAENSLNICNNIDNHEQEAFETPNTHDQKGRTLSHIIIKVPN
jgi:hypothetical protein